MASEFELYGAPGHLIRRLQQIAVALFLAETRRFDITPVQYAALFSIREQPGLDQTALANVIAFDRSTIANVVERLEAKTLITRKAGSADRRTKRLYITPSGRKLLAGAIPAVAKVQDMILAPLAPGERGVFMAMLQRMVDINNSHSRAPLRAVGAGPVRKLP
jgi:DNA-binding MarR family transcriptional regulator